MGVFFCLEILPENLKPWVQNQFPTKSLNHIKTRKYMWFIPFVLESGNFQDILGKVKDFHQL